MGMAMGMGKNPQNRGMEGNGLGYEIREWIREWVRARVAAANSLLTSATG